MLCHLDRRESRENACRHGAVVSGPASLVAAGADFCARGGGCAIGNGTRWSTERRNRSPVYRNRSSFGGGLGRVMTARDPTRYRGPVASGSRRRVVSTALRERLRLEVTRDRD